MAFMGAADTLEAGLTKTDASKAISEIHAETFFEITVCDGSTSPI